MPTGRVWGGFNKIGEPIHLGIYGLRSYPPRIETRLVLLDLLYILKYQEIYFIKKIVTTV